MWLRTECDISFTVSIPTPLILMLRPKSGLHQWVARESYTITPYVPVVEFTDNYGNLCQRLVAPVGEFSIHTSADILTTNQTEYCYGAPFEEIQNLPDSVLTYLLPSRYCESDKLSDLAHEIVMGLEPGYDQVAGIENWIRTNVSFNPDSFHFQLSAVEVNQQREGVCRDHAHLGIALCRSLCIPTRMTVGYLHGLVPMDLHAWFEAYIDGKWHTFDSTQANPFGERVTIAYGHDAADVATFTQFGPALYPDEMRVRVTELESAPL